MKAGAFQTEVTGSSVAYAGHNPQPDLHKSAALDSTVLHPLLPSPVWAPTDPKSCCFSPYSGCMQDGTALGDVELPPWADEDPWKFISLHRQVSWGGSCQSLWNPE